MGLPEKIKERLSPKKSGETRPAKKQNVPAKTNEKSSKPGSAPIARRTEAPGLPYFQPPPLPKDHRAILVACAKTRRASWAILKDNAATGSGDGSAAHEGHRWIFQRNITAVPAANDGSSDKQAGSVGSRSSGPGPEGPELNPDEVDLTGFSCGVCRTSVHNDGIADLVRCSTCATMMCAPKTLYKCPGCRTLMDTSDMSDMTSVNASHGAPKRSGAQGRQASSNPRNPGLNGAGSGDSSGDSRRAIGG